MVNLEKSWDFDECKCGHSRDEHRETPLGVYYKVGTCLHFTMDVICNCLIFRRAGTSRIGELLGG